MQAVKAASKIARRVVVSGFLLLTCAHLLFTQGSSISNRLITASAVTTFLAWGGYAKKSLDLTGGQASSVFNAGVTVTRAQRPLKLKLKRQFHLSSPQLVLDIVHALG